MSKLITISELSQKIGFSERTIYDWVAQKKIPFFRIHGNIRFDEAKIEVWLSFKEVVKEKRLQTA